MKHVYVAGPYTAETPEAVVANVHRAIDTANRLLDAGLWPHVPHLTHYLHERQPRGYEDWMVLDFAILGRMDAVLRVPGASAGAAREVAAAREMGLPVFFSEEEVIAWAMR